MKKVNPKPKKRVKLRQPKTKIEVILKNFYQQLKEGEGNADCLDKFVENNNLMEYKQIGRFSEFLAELLKKMDLTATHPLTEEDFQEVFFSIAERVGEEDGNLELIRDFINNKHPDLVDDLDGYSTEEEVNNEWENHVDEEMKQIEENLEKNKEEYRDVINRVERVKANDIDKYANELSKVIVHSLGKENWKLLLYSIMSPYASEFVINSIPIRNTLHVMFVGDISSGKSKICSILKIISPKAEYYSDFTKASFEGVSTKEEIEEGIVDKVMDGILIVPEFKKVQLPFEREFLDNDTIKIGKGGHEKEVKPNTTLVASINPRDDFFQNGVLLRSQIPEDEGMISRFDVFIPLVVTAQENELILDKLNLFGRAKTSIDLEEIKLNLSTLAKGMKSLKGIKITERQKQMLKDAYKFHNKELPNRPLLILRDLECIARLLSVITMTNYLNRQVEYTDGDMKNGIVTVDNKDVEEALSLWEHLIVTREQIYRENKRHIYSLKEMILQEIMTTSQSKIGTKELYERIVEKQGLCKKTTFYDRISQLILEGSIKQIGKKNSILVAVSV